MPTTAAPRAIELDHRCGHGLDVSLVWWASTDRVAVTVLDAATGSALEVPVGQNERATDVFWHPYAYASRARDE